MLETYIRVYDKKEKKLYQTTDIEFYVLQEPPRPLVIQLIGGKQLGRSNAVLLQFSGIYNRHNWWQLTEKEQKAWLDSGKKQDEWHGTRVFEGDLIDIYDGMAATGEEHGNPVVVIFDQGMFGTVPVNEFLRYINTGDPDAIESEPDDYGIDERKILGNALTDIHLLKFVRCPKCSGMMFFDEQEFGKKDVDIYHCTSCDTGAMVNAKDKSIIKAWEGW